ncbi:TolC family protein [Arcobacter sp. KX21116]|jgi:outer membrane protein TolC|uniref:TolC family protein n=1 Tax=Arcobacter iocasae TaxID=2906515 RepID=UPI0035D4664B|tara:strand:+ start:3215 stop:4582 length:1368 start_codon:yes stop_codon:yes gene_type:complete
MIYKSLLVASLIISSSFSLELDDIPKKNGEELSLQKVVKTAVINDSWLLGNKYSQEAIEESSIAAGTYSDPKITIGASNLPTDTFDLNQEAMTQLKIGVSQMFPRGNSLEIKKEQLRLQSSQYPYQREDRKGKLTVQISQLWLEAYKNQESINLIEKNRSLFEQLADIAESNYSSTLGKTRQQDIVRAQLELTKLEDRLTILKQKKDKAILSLSQWLYSFTEDQLNSENILENSNLVLPKTLPNIEMINKYDFDVKENSEKLLNKFENHPSIKNLEQKIKAATKNIALARENYKPQFALNASYAKREDDLAGKNRADLFSVGVTFDLPVFVKNRQDKKLKVAMLQTKSVKTEKILQFKNLLSSFNTIKANLIRLKDRQSLYKLKLLPQINEQAEASLTAYTNDDGDFAEVVRSRISQLNSQIDILDINVEIQKNIVKYNYLFANNAENILKISNK